MLGVAGSNPVVPTIFSPPRIEPSAVEPDTTPAKSHGTITARVTATQNTAIIDNVTIVGGEINQPPVLQGIGNHTLRAGETIRFTIQATDPDAGPEALQYSAEAF